MACVLYAANNSEKVDFLICASLPLINNAEKTELISEITKSVMKEGCFKKVSKSTGKVLIINKCFLDDVKNIDLSKYISKIKAKTYVIVGLDDSEINVKSSKDCFDLLNCEKELILLPNTPHDLANTPDTKAQFKDTMMKILKN